MSAPAPDRLQQALERIDAANREDPSTLNAEGKSWPLVYYHGLRRTHWIGQLTAIPSDALRIAARAQHIYRWKKPRNAYPPGRIGYLQWREDLKKFHYDETASILRECGMDEALLTRVQTIMLKQGIKRDADVQALEDALCLVFLETQFSEFAKQEADKIDDIVRKTWAKMSDKGRELALGLPLAGEDRKILERALSSE